MSERSVIFKTKGKLDLRSIMTFGLNAKPNTGHPIGFFGTGLKYAIAVLTRNKIPVTIYIDGRKWTISTEDSIFRDKTVTEIFLERHRTLLPPTIKKLPFTTELGKTWELWQAFRELHSNTLDEKGLTFVAEKVGDHFQVKHGVCWENQTNDKGYTCICVESEAFVQEYFDKDKTFLPDGLNQREGTEAVQIFDRPSQHIYYRGIRVLDLAEEERSALTYNILSQIELTEDRTAKSKWDVQYTIQQAVAQLEDRNKIEKVITAPKRSFEGSMNFYAAPSAAFLDVTSEAVAKKATQVTHHALELHKQYTPKTPSNLSKDWLAQVINAMQAGDWGRIEEYVGVHREELIAILEAAHIEQEKLRGQVSISELQVHSDGRGEGTAEDVSKGTRDHSKSSSSDSYAPSSGAEEDDDIPF